jgi:hypothetical protein
LDDPDSSVRAAATDALGIIRLPAYDIPATLDWSPPAFVDWQGWARKRGPTSIASDPPIVIDWHVQAQEDGLTPSRIDFHVNLHARHSQREARARYESAVLRLLPDSVRARLEGQMLHGATEPERAAAARALVSWPPDDYQFRVASCHVWFDDGRQRRRPDANMCPEPSFLHHVCRPSEDAADDLDMTFVWSQNAVFFRTNRPMAIDLQTRMEHGRPWYAYPGPDDLTLPVDLHDLIQKSWGTVSVRHRMIAKPDRYFACLGSPSLATRRNGFSWVQDCSGDLDWILETFGGNLDELGLRWPSMILTPGTEIGGREHTTEHVPSWNLWRHVGSGPQSWVNNRGEASPMAYYAGPVMVDPLFASVIDDSGREWRPRDTLTELCHSAEPVKGDIFLVKSSASRTVGYRMESTSVPIVFTGDLPRNQWKRADDRTYKYHPAKPCEPLEGQALIRALRASLEQRGLTAQEAATVCEGWRKPLLDAQGTRLVAIRTEEDWVREQRISVRPLPTEIATIDVVVMELDWPLAR